MLYYIRKEKKEEERNESIRNQKKKHFVFYDSSEGNYDYCNVYDKFNEIKKVGIRKISANEFKDVFHDDIGNDFDTLSPKEQEERIIDVFPPHARDFSHE